MCNPRSNDQAETRECDVALPRHLYIVVDCKTENCVADHVLTYLGEKERLRQASSIGCRTRS